MISRPKYLAEFNKPPINEVVLGAQFSIPSSYNQIYAYKIWELFKDDFPSVEIHSPLEPTFETFGFPISQKVGINVLSGGRHDRFWFISDDSRELIQFQEDRLLHNWRKDPDPNHTYPRYEYIREKFEAELSRVEDFFVSLDQQHLMCNQAEITYINIFKIQDSGLCRLDEWVRFLDFSPFSPDDYSSWWSDTILDEDENPIARLSCEMKTGYNQEREKIANISLTVRGKPHSGNISSTLDFLDMGREIIVDRFSKITTEKAHNVWERVK
ncbi:MAG: TIGR04255 family protein [Roseibium sp.]